MLYKIAKFFGIRKNPVEAAESSPEIRKNFYRELKPLLQEEEEIRSILDMPVKPRLTIVDERNMVLLRPRNRASFGLEELGREEE